MAGDAIQVLRWAAAGSSARSPHAKPYTSLTKLEQEGLVDLNSMRSADGEPELLVSLTALGRYELERLEAQEDA